MATNLLASSADLAIPLAGERSWLALAQLAQLLADSASRPASQLGRPCWLDGGLGWPGRLAGRLGQGRGAPAGGCARFFLAGRPNGSH